MSTLQDKTKLIQARVGVLQDGSYGNKTADAIIRELGIITPTPAPTIKMALDPGHGMGNRTPGVFDPGCEFNGLREADVVLTWAFALADALQHVGITFYMTRTGGGSTVDVPVSARDNFAKQQNCSHFLSVHINDATPTGDGTETLYRDDKAFAEQMHACVIQGLGLKDRGVKQRNDLAVLAFGEHACVLELGFIQPTSNRMAFMDPVKRKATCTLLAAKLKEMA